MARMTIVGNGDTVTVADSSMKELVESLSNASTDRGSVEHTARLHTARGGEVDGTVVFTHGSTYFVWES